MTAIAFATVTVHPDGTTTGSPLEKAMFTSDNPDPALAARLPPSLRATAAEDAQARAARLKGWAEDHRGKAQILASEFASPEDQAMAGRELETSRILFEEAQREVRAAAVLLAVPAEPTTPL